MKNTYNYSDEMEMLEQKPSLKKEPRLTRINYIRIILATILFIFCIGSLAYVYQGKPWIYLFFITLGGIGSYFAMLTWRD
jgi:hypothetical protein